MMKLLTLLLSFTVASLCFAEDKLPPGHPPLNAQKPVQPATEPAQLPLSGQVVEVINVAQYTYVEVMVEQASRWLAGPTVEVKKGDTINFDKGLEMKDFHSNSLDRTFPSVFFVNRITVGDVGK